jgi:hypothetical protein
MNMVFVIMFVLGSISGLSCMNIERDKPINQKKSTQCSMSLVSFSTI